MLASVKDTIELTCHIKSLLVTCVDMEPLPPTFPLYGNHPALGSHCQLFCVPGWVLIDPGAMAYNIVGLKTQESQTSLGQLKLKK